MKTFNYANLMLVLVTIAWGLTFPVIKTVSGIVDPAVFVAARFVIACLIIIPFLQFKYLRRLQLVQAGLILGFLNSGVYFLQTLALENLSAARCAFLTGTVVIWVPLFGFLFRSMVVNIIHICAAILCLIGLWILTGADIHGIGWADGQMLLAEACFALSLLYIERIGSKSNSLALTFYQILFTCPIPLFIVITKNISWQPLVNFKVVMAVLFCALCATVLTLWLQAKFQPRTTSIHASLIYSLEPFWAAVFSSALFGEVLTLPLIIGGSIMIFSVVVPEIMNLYKYHHTKLLPIPEEGG